MLISIKDLIGNRLGASDGEIGCIKDFYFDDKHWAIRYVVADTRGWIEGRQVLLSPHAFDRLPRTGKTLPVHLTRTQVEESPPMETHQPISRKYEEEYYRYYGWPYYWQGSAVWGLGGFPILSAKTKPFAGEKSAPIRSQQHPPPTHLQSVLAILGYQIQVGTEITGCVTDFLMDDKSWVICQIAVNTGSRFSGKRVFLSPAQVARLSWDESKLIMRPAIGDAAQLPPENISATV